MAWPGGGTHTLVSAAIVSHMTLTIGGLRMRLRKETNEVYKNLQNIF